MSLRPEQLVGDAEAFRRLFIEESRLEARDALEAIVIAYDRALKDEQTKIPSYLMAAIESARLK